MSTIQRRLPQSNPAREKALNKAKNKKDNPGPAGNFLTTPTTNRLDAIQPDYHTGMRQINIKGAAANAATRLKNTAKQLCYIFVSSFIQAFNLGVKMGVYQPDDRRFYQIDESSDALPPMTTDDDLVEVGKHVIDGEADRIAAGGTAHPFPLIATVQTKYSSYKNKNTDQNSAQEELDNAQEAVGALNTEADKVIKKIWDEVETFYNEEDTESMRANARHWGVVYVTLGEKATITFPVSRSNDGTPVIAAHGEIENGGEGDTGQDGVLILETTLVGDVVALFTCPGLQDKEVPFTIVEGVDMTVPVVMDPEV